VPTLKGVLLHGGRRGWMYLRKAGTIILGVSICLWALTSYPKPPAAAPGAARQAVALEYSAAGRIGKALEPVMAPVGFDWKINTALLGAVAAKELFVAQMGIVHALDAADDREPDPLGDALRRQYTPRQALAIMLFCLLGLPCAATVAVVRAESGSWRWAALQWAGLTLMAYLVVLLVYQVGGLMGFA